jgi:IstB-like ATP binding protein
LFPRSKVSTFVELVVMDQFGIRPLCPAPRGWIEFVREDAHGKLGYVPLAEVAAELLFQVIAERAEKAAIIVTTNLPFSEWPQVFTNARLCKAVLDRLTDQAHIIETGSESYRFRRTLRKKTKD